jgi:hypothetical protein
MAAQQFACQGSIAMLCFFKHGKNICPWIRNEKIRKTKIIFDEKTVTRENKKKIYITFSSI